jgi:hypothetical protein
MVDLSHIPLIHETIEESILPVKDYIVHAHIGNCVVKSPEMAAYGDVHPRFGFPNGENDVDEVVEYLKVLLDIGFLNTQTPPVVSFEIKPFGDEDADVVIANAKTGVESGMGKGLVKLKAEGKKLKAKILEYEISMKLVVLDGYTLNPGDLNWEGIKKFGDLEVHDRTPESQIVERCQGAEIIFTNKTPLRESVLSQLPDLKYIGVLATGYNVVDVDYAKARGIAVANVPGYGTASVVQMTFALLLELCQHVQSHSDSVRQGDWAASPDFCYWNYPLIELGRENNWNHWFRQHRSEGRRI